MKKTILLSFLLAGCAGAEIVMTSDNPRGGVVQYKNGNESRNMALDKAIGYCKGPMKIISEELKENVMNINFECGR